MSRWALVAPVKSLRHSVASPPLPCPFQRCLRPAWLTWSPSQVHRTPQQCLLALPKGMLAGRHSCVWPDTHPAEGLSSALPGAGQCGCAVAQVSDQWGLSPRLVTCCLVARTPVLPAPQCSQHRALHGLPGPREHRELCPAPWPALEKSCETLREAVVIARLGTVPSWATRGTGMCSAVGRSCSALHGLDVGQ